MDLSEELVKAEVCQVEEGVTETQADVNQAARDMAVVADEDKAEEGKDNGRAYA